MSAADGVRVVPPAEWVGALTEARDAGFTFFEWLAAVDEIGRADELRVVAVLRDPASASATLRLVTAVPRDAAVLDSVAAVFPAAAWHEREAAEMFGLVFTGGDGRRLLLGPEFEGTPLRKDAVLGARTVGPWPGAKEPGESDASPSRRRMVPPGVPEPEVWGDRAVDEPAPDPAAVAESAVGGRARRRRR